ncbi:MAG: hypothetical protein R3Y24_00275 [Eubacteriales bacterium]
MTIFEYDEEQHIRLEREDAMAEGEVRGEMKGKINLIRKILIQLTTPEEISRLLGVEVSFVTMIAEMISVNPNMTDGEIAERMLQKQL